MQMNISLTPELAKLVQDKVASGMYNNASEVIRDALRHLDEKDPMRELREFLAPRIAEVYKEKFSTKNFDEIIAEAKAEYKSDQQ